MAGLCMRRLYSAGFVSAIVRDRRVPEPCFHDVAPPANQLPKRDRRLRILQSTRLPAAGAVLRLEARARRLARILPELDAAAVADLRADRILAPALGTFARLAL